MNKLEAVIICSGELSFKFLRLTLPHNVGFFDNIVIVSQESDINEFESLKKFTNLTFLVTNQFKKYNFKFNKGAAYNAGFTLLKHNDWVCTLDADVILPPEFAELKKTTQFNKDFCYGARRMLLPKYADFKLLTSQGINVNNYIVPKGLGYGYYCMVNWQSAPIQNAIANYQPIYPDKFDGVGTSDYLFRNQWGETSYGEEFCLGNLIELPMNVVHLGDCLISEGNPSEHFWS